MMRLAHPEYLHLSWLLILCIAVIFWSQKRWKKKRLRLGDEKQREKILPAYIIKNSLIASIFILCAIASWIFALSQPQYGVQSEKVEKAVSDVFLAIDVSRSMLAEDIKPNRLERTKIFADNLLNELGSERVSIIPFAGHAYMTMPLTTDMAAAKMILESLDENTASTQGTSIGEAINLATESAKELQPQRRIMILLTDGENHDKQAVEAAKEAAKVGITIFPIGVGTEEGSPIPAPPNSGSQYFHDRYGNMVISKYNPQLLGDLASETGGAAYNILGGTRVIKNIKERISKLDSQVLSEESFEVKKNYYGFFISFGFLFIISALYIENYQKK